MRPGRTRWLAGLVVAALAAGALTGCGGESGNALPDVCTEQPQRPVRIATAKLIIEFNATDDDVGVHGAFDDNGWSELCVLDPRGRVVALFDPRNRLDTLTMAGVFFESREPPAAEYSMDDLAKAFPEGKYQVRAKSYDGKTLTGTATFTHTVPAAPVITSPALAADAESPGTPVSRAGFEVRWDPVRRSTSGEPLNVRGYEVIVTKEDHDDPHGFSKPIYDVHVGPRVFALRVPEEFFEPGTVYELEVLALEKSGNQTITVGFFVTA